LVSCSLPISTEDLYPDKVVGFLDEVLTDLFEARVEDDSVPEVSEY